MNGFSQKLLRSVIFPPFTRIRETGIILITTGESSGSLYILRAILDRLIYNDEYPGIDENLIDSNVGARN